MKKIFLIIILFCHFAPGFSQSIPPPIAEVQSDTSSILDEVTVKAFEQNRNLSKLVAVVKLIEFNNADRYNKTSLVNGFNTVAGVRMEERSPGSYRINIRGSSLRSPFGVRNVKVYWNDIPVTDPGGNTYFNQFAWNNFSSIEIVKGPTSSMYGAGTGGLILMHSLSPWQPGVSAEYITGSYNLQNVFITARLGKKENKSLLSFAHNQTDGYRTQSRMGRDNFSWVTRAVISDIQQISASVLLTNLYYQTPGALTLSEFKSNPKAARPAAGTLPSAVNAKAAIEQMNFLAGITHHFKITPAFTNHTTFYAAFTELKNAAIRNYEKRDEPHLGARTIFTYEKKGEECNWQLTGGGEFQHGFFNTTLFRNKNGNPDSLLTDDDVLYVTNSYFIQGDINWKDKWTILAGLSLNKTRVSFTRLNRYPVVAQERTYQNELAPRISVKKTFNEKLSLNATVSRGFSPPTTAELLPSTGVISTDLEAEYGWNYEMTAGYNLFHRQLRLEATGFYFKLNNALVQRRDLTGADFFVNAGDVQQKGAEITADFLHSTRKGPFDYYRVNMAYTYNHFRYGSFKKGPDDFSGKTVPSVPYNTVSLLGDIQLKNGVYTNITYYAASKIFLNDANTAAAEAFHLLGWRLGWKKTLNKKYKPDGYRMNCYLGGDNLLDETYSLGNDINAAANRFYNAAPRRNFYVGLSFQWNKAPKK
ncbi:MAG: TonB-dependent receptor plug domain-containing protein [Bacteroidota bacterium]|nr:TonB-dependent receptor plug domain-containing protein [Bacteroidota bacterium]